MSERRTGRARPFATMAAWSVLAAWALVSAARMTLLVEPAEPPIGSDARPFIAFAREVMPATARYLYLEPILTGPDPGFTPRLRHDLYPRGFENASAAANVRDVREQMAREGRRYLVVPLASLYPPAHWLRADVPWARRVALDDSRYLLVLPDDGPR